MKRKLFPLLLSGLLLFPNAVLAQANFTDVTEHWAATEIESIYQKGYLKGISSDKFSPNTQVTRAELAAALDRMFDFNYADLEFIKAPTAKDFYDDIPENQWYSDVALKCGLNGIIDTKDRKFCPDQPVTRLEIAEAVNNSFHAKKLGVMTTLMWPAYEDTTNLPQEDQSDISFIFNAGIMKGKDSQHFNPHDNITRAELAVILSRTLNTLEHAFPISEEPIVQQKTDLRGEIKEITTDDNQITKLFIEGQLEKDTTYDRARVTITEETLIVKGATEIPLQDLKTGSKVEVEFTGPVMKSYPAQGTAKTIRVID